MSTTSLQQGRVTSVIDGDTVDLISGATTLRLRLACLDAPELAQVPHGQLAKDALTGLLKPGAIVRYQQISLDRYGRVVAEVFDRNNRNLGAEMVRLGRAFVDPTHASACDATQLLALQTQSRDRRLGIWFDAGLQKPWDFRARTAQDPAAGSISAMPAATKLNKVQPYRGKRVITCSRIDSKQEAQAWLAAGHRYLDADRDGCACESQFPC